MHFVLTVYLVSLLIMGIYSNFNVSQMLDVLNRHADTVSLTSVGSGGDWMLKVSDQSRGDFQQTGSLFRVVMGAFKPYLDIAKKERIETSDKLAILFEND